MSSNLVVFGDPQWFALQCWMEVCDNQSETPIMFGRLCLMANHRKLGEPEVCVMLNIPVMSFQEFVNSSAKVNDSFVSQDPLDIWQFLSETLYGDQEHLRSSEIVDRENQYRGFCLFPNSSEAFDGEMAFLVEYQNSELFVWQDWESKQIYHLFMPLGTAKDVLRNFIQGFQTLLETMVVFPRSILKFDEPVLAR